MLIETVDLDVKIGRIYILLTSILILKKLTLKL